MEAKDKAGFSLVTLGIVTCAMLVIIDLKIKQDLIREAKILETRLAQARQETRQDYPYPSDSVPYVPSGNSVPDDSGMEAGSDLAEDSRDSKSS